MTFWTTLKGFKNNFSTPHQITKQGTVSRFPYWELDCGFHFEKLFSERCVRSLENDLSSTLTLDQKLYLGSDDEADLIKELQSMCSSKSESDISKVSCANGEDVEWLQQWRDFLENYCLTFSLKEVPRELYG